MLRARPIATRASTLDSMKVVYDKESIDPCISNAHYCECVPFTSFRTSPRKRYSAGINDDESGLHHDYEVWLEKLAPHAPIDQYWHNRTAEDACGHALSSSAMPEGRAVTTHHLPINAALKGAKPSSVGEHSTCQVMEPLQRDLNYMKR